MVLSSYRGTPLEVLHTILLGLAKYMLKQFMPRLTNRMKEEVLARVNAFPHSGLRSKMFGNVCRYYNSFVGRDFKGWSQMSVFIFLSPYLSSDDRKVLLSFSKVSTNFNSMMICFLLGVSNSIMQLFLSTSLP